MSVAAINEVGVGEFSPPCTVLYTELGIVIFSNLFKFVRSLIVYINTSFSLKSLCHNLNRTKARMIWTLLVTVEFK